MASRLPVVNADGGAWGAILNDYLSQAHNADGTPKLTELGYAEITTSVSVTAITEATANTIVTAPAITFDGATTVIVEFFADAVTRGTTYASLFLFDGATSIGRCGIYGAPVGEQAHSVRRLTPSAGAHTYSFRASVDAGSGAVTAGTAGVGNPVPTFIRITRA